MNVIEAVMSKVWAITPEYLRIILKVANRETRLEELTALQKERPALLDGTARVMMRGDVAIIPVYGPIMKFANIFTMISGATSLRLLMRDFNVALEDPAVESIIFDIDSPGGEVNGVNEFAQAVYAARGKKPIAAYIGGMGASAAYWIASAAEKIYIDKTAMVGSIGVVATYIDDSERLAKEGVKEIEIVSASSPAKRPDVSTDEGRAQIQRRVDSLQEIFVTTVARNRSVSKETVLSDFGRGDVFVGEYAIAAGLADGVASLEGLIKEYSNQTHQFSQEEIMSEETKYAADEITAEMIREKFPQVAAEIALAAAETERIRIREIENLARPGIEELINKAKFESDDTAADVALAILAHDKRRTEAQKKALAADAEEMPALAAAAPDESPDAIEQRAIDAAVVQGLNGRFQK